VSDSPTDFYHQKTDAELQFFVENPTFYHPSLIEAVQRELRRRGVASAAPTPMTEPVAPIVATPLAAPPVQPAHPPQYEPEDTASSGPKRGAIALGIGAALVFSLGIFYFLQHKEQPAPVAKVAAPAKPKAPPKLVEVPTSVIPNYDAAVTQCIAQQLQRVPAAERATAASKENLLRQYRELVKRFWAAETQTEYLTSQAHEGKAGPMFADQALVVRQTWQAWNKAAMYTYEFGPAMQKQFDRMQSIAGSQQHILEKMPELLPERQFLTDKEVVARETDVEAWLADLLPKSPVTGHVYKAPVLTIHM
jgi:hypothetical protein